MQSSRDRPSAVTADLPPVLAGVAFAISGVGVALALADAHSPLRAPFVIFFLFAGPACGLYSVLPGLDRTARAATAVAGAAGIDMAVAGTLSSMGVLAAGGSVAAVAAITALLLLCAATRRTGWLRLPRHSDSPPSGGGPARGASRPSGAGHSR